MATRHREGNGLQQLSQAPAARLPARARPARLRLAPRLPDFLLLNFKSSLYASDVSFIRYVICMCLSQPMPCLFILFKVSFTEQSFNKFQLNFFSFTDHAVGCIVKNHHQMQGHLVFLLCLLQ